MIGKRWVCVAFLLPALTAAPALAAPPAASPWNLPRKSLPHLVAHYMPWFGDARQSWRHWGWDGQGTKHNPAKRLPDGRRDLASVFSPLIGPYSSTSPRVIAYHLQTAKAAGIEAFIVDWYGPGTFEDQTVGLLLDDAAKLDLRIALCYEEKINFPDYRKPASRNELLANVVKDLSYIVERYANHPAYLKRDGKPLILQFNYWNNGRGLKPEEWWSVLGRLPRPVVYGELDLDPGYHPARAYPRIDAAYNWWFFVPGRMEEFSRRAAELQSAGRLSFYIEAVCPGFDDSGVNGWGGGPRQAARNGLTLFKKTFDQALARQPELVQVVTFNDWQEGTVVEPSREDGFWYLDALETWWGERTGRAVNLDDNRQPFLAYVRSASAEEKAELPGPPLERYLAKKPVK